MFCSGGRPVTGALSMFEKGSAVPIHTVRPTRVRFLSASTVGSKKRGTTNPGIADG